MKHTGVTSALIDEDYVTGHNSTIKAEYSKSRIALAGLSSEENSYFYVTLERVVNSAAEGQVKGGFLSTTQRIFAF